MGLARLASRGQAGMDAYAVTVEVHVAGGLPSFTVAGLPATVVRESRERVRAALTHLNFTFPVSRIVAHLGPADRPKTGGCFDLPVALGVLLASGQVRADIEGLEFLGELALNGELRPVPGILPAVAAARAANHELIVPAANAGEAALVEGAVVRCAKHLGEVVQFLRGECELPPVTATIPRPHTTRGRDLSDVLGQQQAKRALTLAAAGGHHLLMVGPPGSGKSMLAERLPGLLPIMDYREALDVAAVRSVAGLSVDVQAFYRRPFRAPHHGASPAALAGGGARPRPGEISLAHRGVLFLDELPEFPRHTLEALREPIETGKISIARANGQATFPARFQLIAAMNPCPCGFLGDRQEQCACSPHQVQTYRRRISGPLLDRFDLQIEVPRLSAKLLSAGPSEGPDTATLRGCVSAARRRQLARSGLTNVELGRTALDKVVVLDDASRRLLSKAIDHYRLSARGYVRILRVARTIADLAGEETVNQAAIAEAISLRCTFVPNGMAKAVNEG